MRKSDDDFTPPHDDDDDDDLYTTPDDDVWFEAIPTDPSEVWLERNYHNIDNGKYISTQRSHVVCFLWKHIILFNNPLIYRGLVNTQSP